MRGKFFTSREFKRFAIILFVVCFISVVSLSDNSVISGAINAVTNGLFSMTASATASIDTLSYDELKAENEKLKNENAKLREQLVEYYETKEENQRLWEYYDIKKENPSLNLLPANVIKRDTNDDFYSFTLDCGSATGVSVNDAVITENGLVGWVCEVDYTSCKVKTVLSPDTKVAAVDMATSDSGIVSGSVSLCDENRTRLMNIASDHKIKAGDIVVSSGTGGVYPKNLVIGEVKELKFNSYDTTIYAVVEPYEDIATITAAAVVISK